MMSTNTDRPRTFHDARPAFLSGQSTPRDYLESCLATIEEREPELQAFVTLNVERARAAADQSSARYRAGAPLSAVDGMPIGIKDLFETVDMPTTMGSPVYQGRRTGRDAAAVKALRGAGAVIIGKTVTTEFGFYTPGPTRNPHDPARTPGGSSSGSAAAVGGGLIPAALGTQVIGSVTRPSSFCGCVGFKPSLGALNRSGAQMCLSQNHVGIHAGAVQDVWAVATAIADGAGGDPGFIGFDGGDGVPPPARPRTLIRLQTGGWPDLTDGARAAFEALVGRIEGADITIIDRRTSPEVAALEDAIADAVQTSHVICGFELRWPLLEYRDRGPGTLSPVLEERLAEWSRFSRTDYAAALERRAGARRALANLAEHADGVLAPAALGPAPVGLNSTGDPACNAAASLLGAPAFSLPLMTVDGLPFGLQVLGFADRDRQLTATAGWLVNR